MFVAKCICHHHVVDRPLVDRAVACHNRGVHYKRSPLAHHWREVGKRHLGRSFHLKHHLVRGRRRTNLLARGYRHHRRGLVGNNLTFHFCQTLPRLECGADGGLTHPLDTRRIFGSGIQRQLVALAHQRARDANLNRRHFLNLDRLLHLDSRTYGALNHQLVGSVVRQHVLHLLFSRQRLSVFLPLKCIIVGQPHSGVEFHLVALANQLWKFGKFSSGLLLHLDPDAV